MLTDDPNTRSTRSLTGSRRQSQKGRRVVMGTTQIEIGAPRDRALASYEGSDSALLERLRTLRSIVPAMATEVAIARREGARLRRENESLRNRLTEMERGSAAGSEARIDDVEVGSR
jgi:hypothetical protein